MKSGRNFENLKKKKNSKIFGDYSSSLAPVHTFWSLEMLIWVPKTPDLPWQVCLQSGQTKAGALELIEQNGEKRES